MDARSLRVTQNACFSLLTHTKQLILVTFKDKTARIGVGFRTNRQTNRNGNGMMDGQTDVQVEIVIYMIHTLCIDTYSFVYLNELLKFG